MTVEKIGKYLIKNEINSGTMGTVFKCHDSALDIDVAIKVIKTGMDDEYFRKRFFEEGQKLAKLDHPNIIKVLYMDTDAGNHPYIVMEYVEGEDLRTLIANRAFVPFEKKIKIVIDVCMGLQHAHVNSLIHRDIKPANIRIKRSGETKILDFGLAKQTTSDLTRTGGLSGSPIYMSPEQWNGDKLDGRSDLFSIATVLYELISYIKLFDAESFPAIMRRVISEPHTPLTEILPACAPELSELLDHALAKNRDNRGNRDSSCLEFAAELQRFCLELPKQCGNARKQIDQLKSEIVRCQQKSAELQSLGLLDPSLFEIVADGKETAAGITLDSNNEISDYGFLLHYHSKLQRQLDNFNGKLKEALPLLRLLRAGHQQLEDGRLDECQNTLQEFLLASPANPSGLQLLAACRQAIEKRRIEEEKRARLSTMVSRAREYQQWGQFSHASQVLLDILQIDPNHSEAIQLGETIRQQIAFAVIQKKKRVVQLLEECRDLFRAGKFDEARRASEELLKLSREEKEVRK